MSGGFPVAPYALASQGRVSAAMASLRFSCGRRRVSARLSASRRLAKITASAILLRLARFAGPWPVRVRQASPAEDAVPLSMIQVQPGADGLQLLLERRARELRGGEAALDVGERGEDVHGEHVGHGVLLPRRQAQPPAPEGRDIAQASARKPAAAEIVVLVHQRVP